MAEKKHSATLPANPLKKCAKCGTCTTVCPVAMNTGRESHTARGKLHLFSQAETFSSPYYFDLLAKCLQCRACDTACPRSIEPSAQIRTHRTAQTPGQEPAYYKKLLTRSLLRHPNAQKLGSRSLQTLHELLPSASGLRHRLELLLPGLADSAIDQLPQPSGSASQKFTYYPGCLASHLYHDIPQAMAILAYKCDISLNIPTGLGCCGLASHASGHDSQARELAWENITILSQNNDPILTSCASCWSHLTSYPQLFKDEPEKLLLAQQVASRVNEFSTFFSQHNLTFKQQGQTIFYHDPCHLLHRAEPILAPPRALLMAATGTKPVQPAGGSSCCGQGGLFHLANPELSKKIHDNLLKNIVNLQPAYVVTTCSGCLLQWQQGLVRHNSNITALHLAVFLAQQLRY